MDNSPVHHFIRFCMDANLRIKLVEECLKKYLLAYQKHILKKHAYDTLFMQTAENEQFICWEYIDRRMPKHEAQHWISMFKYFDFSKVPTAKSELHAIQTHLTAIGVNTNLACEVFILKNTNFISSQHSIERLFDENKISDSYNKSMQFFAKSADLAFDATETTALFCHIMNTAVIEHSDLEKQIQFILIKESELNNNFQVRQIRATGRRPKLRSKLQEIQTDARSVFDTDTFTSWCQMIRFPSVFSLQAKHRLYFLMSQPIAHVEKPHAHVNIVTQDRAVLKALETAHVQKPEHDILHKVITSMQMLDSPFQELQDFKNESMGAFPVAQKNEIKWNDLLHLYVCAYQSQWKEIWKQLVPLLSHQVIRDVEAFTNRRKYNFEKILSILNEA
jgi:hypothetical protein